MDSKTRVTPEIPALPTAYGGRIFGSRYKARWAMFMDLMEVEYVYRTEVDFPEIEGWQPDFYLPKRGRFIHASPLVKPSRDEAQAKAFLLSCLPENMVTSLTFLSGKIGTAKARWVNDGFEIKAPYRCSYYRVERVYDKKGEFFVPMEGDGSGPSLEVSLNALWAHCEECSACGPTVLANLLDLHHADGCAAKKAIQRNLEEEKERLSKEAGEPVELLGATVMAITCKPSTDRLDDALRTAATAKLDSWANLRLSPAQS